MQYYLGVSIIIFLLFFSLYYVWTKWLLNRYLLNEWRVSVKTPVLKWSVSRGTLSGVI